MIKNLFVGLLLFLSSSGFAEISSSDHKSWSFLQSGLVPIQSGGRLKPLDSFARESVLFITGSRTFEGWKPMDMLFSWISKPHDWEGKSFIRINREDVKRQLGLEEKRVFFSPGELFRNSILLQYAQKSGQANVSAAPPGTPRTNPRDQELRSVIERLSLFNNLVSGDGWALIPKPVPQAWGSIAEDSKSGEAIRSLFVKMIKSYQSGDSAQFEREAVLLKAAVEGEIPDLKEKQKNLLVVESFYNHIRPFMWAWIFYLSGALIWIGCAWFKSGEKEGLSIQRRVHFFRMSAFSAAGVALFFHLLGIVLRCFIAGRPPVTNMYESIMWVSFGVMLFALILFWIHKQEVILTVASTLAALGLIAGDAAPVILDPNIHPLVPVLRSNYWLTIHVLTITLGYAAFALTLGLANISLFQFLGKPNKQKVANLNQLTYRAMQFGVVLIAAGTILGGIWADYSWGRFWGWDPKEVWALITLLAYLVILHGRYASWVGPFGFAAWSAVSFLTVVMAWYGVNFILGVGLHSYGFSTGGTPWVLGFVAAEVLYVLAVSAVHFKKQGSIAAAAS